MCHHQAVRMTKYFPRKRDNWSRLGDKQPFDNHQITAYTDGNGRTYRIREHVYVRMDQASDPYGIAFIHAFRQRKDLIYMDVRWYYRFRDLPWQLQSKLDLDMKKNRAQCHSCDSSERKTQRKLLENKAISKLKLTEKVRLKNRELFASEILDTCLASFIVDRCCIVCYRDITEVVDFRPFADTFYYLFTYNPHHRRLASTQGEIRIGAQFQAEIPDLVSIRDDSSGASCCLDAVQKQCMRKDVDTSSEPCLAGGSVRDDASTCSSELSSEFAHAKRRRLLRSQSADDKCVSKARKESPLVSEADSFGEEVYRWRADLAEQRISPGDFQTYMTAVKTIALFCNTCEQGNARLLSENGSSLSCPGVCESPWKRRRASDDYMKQCAFNALHDANYSLAKALDVIGETSLVPPMKKLWTEDDQKRFQRGIRQLGKNFYRIQKECLPEKSLGEVIEFYYCWKKTVQGQMIRPKRRLKPMLQRRIRQSAANLALSNGEKNETPSSSPATDDLLTSDPNHDDDKSDEKDDGLPASKCSNCSFIPADVSELRLLQIDKSNGFYCVKCLDHYNRYGEIPAEKEDVLEFDETVAKGRLKDAMDSLLIKSHLGQPEDPFVAESVPSLRHARQDTPAGKCVVLPGGIKHVCGHDSPAEGGLARPTSAELPDEGVSPVKSMEKMVMEATGELSSARALGDGSDDADWAVRAESRALRCDIELSHSDKYRLVRIWDRGKDDSCARTDVVCISGIRSGKRRRQRDPKSTRRPPGGRPDWRATGNDETRVSSPNTDEHDDVSVESKSEQLLHSAAAVPSPFGPAVRASSDDAGLLGAARGAAQGKLHFGMDTPALRQLREMALARTPKYSERGQTGFIRQRRPLSPQINPLLCSQQQALQQYMQASMGSALSGGSQSMLYPPQEHSMLSPWAGGFGMPGARQPEYDFNSLLPALTENARMHPSAGRRQSPRAFQTHNHAHLHAHSHTHLHLNDNSHANGQASTDFLPHRHLPFPGNSTSISSNPFLAAALQQPPNANPFFQHLSSGLGDFNLFGGKEFLEQFRPPPFPGKDNSAQTPLEVLQAMGYPSLLQNNQAFPGMGSNQAGDNSDMHSCLRINGFPSNSPLGQYAVPQWYQHLSSQVNSPSSMPNSLHQTCSYQPQTLLAAAMIMRSAGVSPDQIQQHLLHYQQQQMLMNAPGLPHTQLGSLITPTRMSSQQSQASSLGLPSQRCVPRQSAPTDQSKTVQWAGRKENTSRNGSLKSNRSQPNSNVPLACPSQTESPTSLHPDESSCQPGGQQNCDQRGGSKRRRVEGIDRVSSVGQGDQGPSDADRLEGND